MVVDPGGDVEWPGGVPGDGVRNWCDGDLLIDWLTEYGEQHGFRRDDRLPGYDRVFDLPRFLMEQGRRFEQALLVDLQARWPVTRISTRPDEARSLAAAEATWDVMKGGAPGIGSAGIRDSGRRHFGVAEPLRRD